jgi:hypothetical protein
MPLTAQQRELRKQKRNEAFSVWVDTIRLRGSMRGLLLERITVDEWKEYDSPTYACPSYSERAIVKP